MGLLLRAKAQRYVSYDLRPFQFPELQHGFRRFFGASAVLEDTQHVDETAGPMANEGDVPKGQTEECLQTSDTKQENATRKFSASLNTDELTRLILEKMKGKNNIGSQKKKESLTQTNLPPSLKSKSSQVKGDNWQEALGELHKMAGKNQGTLTSPMLSSCERLEDDDFADLDGLQMHLHDGNTGREKGSPQHDFFKLDGLQMHLHDGDTGRGKASMQHGHGKASLQHDFFKSLITSNKPKGDTSREKGLPRQGSLKDLGGSHNKQEDVGLKILNQQVKSKDIRPTSSRFVGGLDLQRVSTPADTSRQRVIPFNSSRGAISNDISGTAAQNLMVQEPKGASIEVEREEKALPMVKKEALQTSTDVPVSVLGHTVCIRNVPEQTNLALVKETLSIHGEIVSWYKKYNQDGTYSAYIEFKLAEGLDSAIASGWLQVDSKALSIVRVDPPVTTVVRLSKVGCDTSADQLSTVCNKFGSIDNIRRRGNGVFDVFYNVDELPNMPRILESLNAAMLNKRRLVALPAPVLHPAVKRDLLKSSEGHAWHASHMSQLLHKIEGRLDTVSVCFEDLKVLNAMVDEMAS